MCYTPVVIEIPYCLISLYISERGKQDTDHNMFAICSGKKNHVLVHILNRI